MRAHGTSCKLIELHQSSSLSRLARVTGVSRRVCHSQVALLTLTQSKAWISVIHKKTYTWEECVLVCLTELVVAPRHVPLVPDGPLPLVCLEVAPEVLLVPGPVPALGLPSALLPARRHCLHPVTGRRTEVIARVGGPRLLTRLTRAVWITHLQY